MIKISQMKAFFWDSFDMNSGRSLHSWTDLLFPHSEIDVSRHRWPLSFWRFTVQHSPQRSAHCTAESFTAETNCGRSAREFPSVSNNPDHTAPCESPTLCCGWDQTFSYNGICLCPSGIFSMKNNLNIILQKDAGSIQRGALNVLQGAWRTFPEEQRHYKAA